MLTGQGVGHGAGHGGGHGLGAHGLGQHGFGGHGFGQHGSLSQQHEASIKAVAHNANRVEKFFMVNTPNCCVLFLTSFKITLADSSSSEARGPLKKVLPLLDKVF